jgi:hypothetical protein
MTLVGEGFNPSSMLEAAAMGHLVIRSRPRGFFEAAPQAFFWPTERRRLRKARDAITLHQGRAALAAQARLVLGSRSRCAQSESPECSMIDS